MNLRRVAVLLLLCPAATTGADNGDQPFARIAIDDRGTLYVGQRVRASIEVLSPEPLYRAPIFPDIDIEGSIVLQPERSGGSFSERHRGATWYGVRRGYAIYPQRPGSFAIPAVRVRIPVTDASTERVLSTDPARFEAVAAPVDVPVDALIVSSRVTVRQSFHPADFGEGGPVVGDALERRIAITAEDNLGMLIPPIDFGDTDELISYPARPEIGDQASRGRVTGHRNEAVTYLFPGPGTVALPDIAVSWWNPQTATLQVEVMKGMEVPVGTGSIEAASRSISAAKRMESMLGWLRDRLMIVTLALIASVVLVQLIRRVTPVLRARLSAWRTARVNSFARRWRELRDAVAANDDDVTVAAFWRWIDRQQPGAAWSAVVRDPQVRAAWTDFERARYGDGAPVQLTLPSRPTPDTRLRSDRADAADGADGPDGGALAPLNPTGAQSTTGTWRT